VGFAEEIAVEDSVISSRGFGHSRSNPFSFPKLCFFVNLFGCKFNSGVFFYPPKPKRPMGSGKVIVERVGEVTVSPSRAGRRKVSLSCEPRPVT